MATPGNEAQLQKVIAATARLQDQGGVVYESRLPAGASVDWPEQQVLDGVIKLANKTETPTNAYDDYRAWITPMLELVIKDREKAWETLQEELNRLLEKVPWRMRLDYKKRTLIPQAPWAIAAAYPEGLYALGAYAMALFLDEKRDFGRTLRRCGLESCRKFFRDKTPKDRQKRRVYCRPAHKKRHDDLLAAEKMREWRRKQKDKGKGARK